MTQNNTICQTYLICRKHARDVSQVTPIVHHTLNHFFESTGTTAARRATFHLIYNVRRGTTMRFLRVRSGTWHDSAEWLRRCV